MAKEAARGGEVEAVAAAPPPRNLVTYTRRKRKRTKETSGSPAVASVGAGMCDDILRGIFARVPARTAVASMAISRHHQALLRCSEFRALHCRLAPPLPDPHVAYIATAKVKRSGGGRNQPVSGYHGFHVAGAGVSGSAPMRALAGPTFPRMTYVSTCHGVVLLVRKARPASCVLWNPAIADEEEEVRVPVSDDYDCAALGLGCGRRSKTYKLLLSRQRKLTTPSSSTRRDPKELMVYTLCDGGGGGGEQPRLRTLLSEGLNLNGEISGESSLYLDGTIYLPHVVDKAVSVILAFDVDDETVTAIDLPGERDEHGCKLMSTTLLLISGRPCVDTQDSHGRALWLLTVDHRWERKCIIDDKASISRRDNRLDLYSITGVWDCGGVLFMYLRHKDGGEDDKLCMYCTATKRMIEVNLPRKLTPQEEWEYAMCWGYKPTLVSPGSIVGGDAIGQDEEERRARTADIMAALMPLNERDRRNGHEATLHTVCFMEFLVRIMQKLPENMDEVAEMPLLKAKDSGKEFYYSVSDPELDSDAEFEARYMSYLRRPRRMLHPY